MIKRLLLVILNFIAIIVALPARAQYIPYTYLNENFDVACVTTLFATHWKDYNPNPATASGGAWTCTATDGNHNTPGMMCTGYYAGTYNIDTAYLITPLMNLGGYAGDIYLHFDSKTSKVVGEGKLSVIESPDSQFVHNDSDLVSTTLPLIGEPADSEGWVTHEIKLNQFRSVGDFYLTFRYISTATSGSIWYIDNVRTNIVSVLDVAGVSRERLSLNVTGIPTGNEVDLSYSVPVAGMYRLLVYDMVGREVYSEQLYAQSGKATHTISGLGLHAGMYCIKMDNGINYGITKMMTR